MRRQAVASRGAAVRGCGEQQCENWSVVEQECRKTNSACQMRGRIWSDGPAGRAGRRSEVMEGCAQNNFGGPTACSKNKHTTRQASKGTSGQADKPTYHRPTLGRAHVTMGDGSLLRAYLHSARDGHKNKRTTVRDPKRDIKRELKTKIANEKPRIVRPT